MKLDTEMSVSSMPPIRPTKLGLRPGTDHPRRRRDKGLVTRSANDAAVVIAESIAGDEDGFAKADDRERRARSA